MLIAIIYLPGAQRISINLVKARDLLLSTADKEIVAKISLLYQDVVKKSFFSEPVMINTNPEFNQSFVFQLLEHSNVSIDKATRQTLSQTSNFRENSAWQYCHISNWQGAMDAYDDVTIIGTQMARTYCNLTFRGYWNTFLGIQIAPTYCRLSLKS